jgi:light-regulated signal transduction histidine kinase (bacteriophytochrome)
LESKVRERTSSLERSNADLRQFSYIVSHDLREPLRTVTGCLTLLTQRSEGKLDAESQKYANFAVESATRMQMLISGLSAYVRAGTEAVELTEISLQDVLAQARYALYQSIRENGAEIKVDGSLPPINGDMQRLVLVFQNLLSNSIKFRKPQEPPKIEIGSSVVDGMWRITVKDNGIGFDQKYAEKIFGVFQRLNGPSEYPGAGMGLAISKRIVESHGGRIYAESEVGNGAVFHVVFPRCGGGESTGDKANTDSRQKPADLGATLSRQLA